MPEELLSACAYIIFPQVLHRRARDTVMVGADTNSIRESGNLARRTALILFFLLLSFARTDLVLCAEDDDLSGADEYTQIRMGGSLWETLIENGVDPGLWKTVFEYNRANNPAFKRLRSAKNIPKGTLIYIPADWEAKPKAEKKPSKKAPPSPPARPVVRDTVGLPDGTRFIHFSSSGKMNLSDLIGRYCLPGGITDRRAQMLLVRNVRSDLRDIYRRLDKDLHGRDTTYYLPLHLLAESQLSLSRRVEAFTRDPRFFVPRDSLLELGPGDICHVAAAGEDYAALARRYIGGASACPSTYVYRQLPAQHLAYMAQIIRHYNLNQPLWPGKRYFIPGFLLNGVYFSEQPKVEVTRRTKNLLYYSNGLVVSLDYHVTRNRSFWKGREQYFPPLERHLEAGRPAFPDLLVWHRTGLDPEIGEILRAKGREHFSLRYIFRTSVTNYYIDEHGYCYLITDPEKNPRDHAGASYDYRSFWAGEPRVSDVSIGVEIESGFQGDLSLEQIDTARLLQEMLRCRFIIPLERIVDHRKVACRRGPDQRLVRGRKADGLTLADRQALGLAPVLDPDVLRSIVDPCLDDIQLRQSDSLDYWFKVPLDPDLETSARRVGWWMDGGFWRRPASPVDSQTRPSAQ
jgi:hypothetical protein